VRLLEVFRLQLDRRAVRRAVGGVIPRVVIALFKNGVVRSTDIIEFRPRRGSLRKFSANPLFVPATVSA
jgi:hypothetical protein